jgi:hypothetical protein
MYPGAVLGGEWIEVALVEGEDGSWRVYERLAEPNRLWRAVRVAAVGAAPSKANYWLAWNGDRLAKGKDSQNMEQYRPLLFAAVLDILREGEALDLI